MRPPCCLCCRTRCVEATMPGMLHHSLCVPPQLGKSIRLGWTTWACWCWASSMPPLDTRAFERTSSTTLRLTPVPQWCVKPMSLGFEQSPCACEHVVLVGLWCWHAHEAGWSLGPDMRGAGPCAGQRMGQQEGRQPPHRGGNQRRLHCPSVCPRPLCAGTVML